MSKYLALFALILSGCVDSALADVPLTLSNGLGYARAGSAVWSREHAVPTSASIAGFVGEAGTVSAVGEAHLFEFGTLVTISCDVTATFCWVQDTALTMTTGGVVTDSESGSGIGADGPGSCFRVLAGTYRDNTVWRDNFRNTSKVGRRQGYCTVNATTLDWPCASDADCSTSGVCVTTQTGGLGKPFERIRGAFLTSRAGSSATCFISEEK